MSVRLFPKLDENQRLMLDAVVRLTEAGCPLTGVRDRADGSAPSDPGLRRTLADVGCYGLLSTEELGGGSVSGNGVVDAALIAAERGARLQPGPFVATSVVVHALTVAGANAHQADVLTSLIAGDAAASWTVVDAGSLSVRRHEQEWVLSGTVAAVQDADECEWLLMTLAQDGNQILIPLAADGAKLVPLERLDVTHRFFDVHLDDVTVPVANLLTPAGSSQDLVDRQFSIAAVLAAAEAVGAMDSDLRLAVEYAKTRIAFGRPIGSFQAVKHRLADTSLIVEMAKGIVAAAADAVGRGAADGDALASVAKAFVSERSIEAAHNCFQVFGGIGFTWEHDQHLFLRRLASDAYLFGSPNWHRDRLWKHADTESRRAHV
ncbi:acyl-CoA dehydrogenase family protein [Microtetraspora sp. NBRC 16547]|uniref:acyl-CoA dehydrogenase family protein n=1 Tax=Microtetraspora sp. NBRC 16547 TaxID=3030993 RepID=UPI0024A27361|nr:acyl-CoA dehydrogenase family protein [Microtetraspora sp. NBRC 16547]GLX02670.1 acyl-CoA dehydrogenase [Microtetraspora sp. NBRC 16547]